MTQNGNAFCLFAKNKNMKKRTWFYYREWGWAIWYDKKENVNNEYYSHYFIWIESIFHAYTIETTGHKSAYIQIKCRWLNLKAFEQSRGHRFNNTLSIDIEYNCIVNCFFLIFFHFSWFKTRPIRFRWIHSCFMRKLTWFI